MLPESVWLPHALQGQAPSEAPFEDLTGHWCRPFIERAVNAGIVTAGGYSENFNPDQVVPCERWLIFCSRGLMSVWPTCPEIGFRKQGKSAQIR